MTIRRLTSLALAIGGLVGSVAAGGSPATAAVPVRGTFTPLDPARILDTRDGTGVADSHRGPLGRGEVLELDVTGVAGVPDSGAGAVVLNVTVTQASGPGYVTVYPCGDARPVASNVNFLKGVDVANQVTAKVGRDGRVCFFTSAATQLLADVSGWYGNDVATAPGFFYEPLTPARIVDTRDGTGLGNRTAGPLAPNEVLAFTVPGSGGVPSDADVRAVTLNVAAVDASQGGYLTVYPCDRPRPNASTINVDPSNSTIANLATVRVSGTGQVCVVASVTTGVIVDTQGYFTPTPAVTFTSMTPVRVLDTRDGTGIVGSRPARAAAGDVLQLQITGQAGVPADARAVLLNVTITGAIGRGFVTAWPCGRVRPLASFLNYVRGVDQANLTPVRIGDGGKVCLFVQEGTDVVADVNGYFTLPAV